jgi:hypothetical protein
MAKKINKEPSKEKEFESYLKTINKKDIREVSIAFGTWLNLYFECWNPDDNTWIDSNKEAFTTEELFYQFSIELTTK